MMILKYNCIFGFYGIYVYVFDEVFISRGEVALLQVRFLLIQITLGGREEWMKNVYKHAEGRKRSKY